MALGLLLVVLFLVWPARYQTGHVRSRGEVSRVYVQCGTPWSILNDRQFSSEARTPWIQEQCVKTSRTRLVNIAVFSVPLLALGVVGLTRGRYRRLPLTSVLRPLPRQLWWQHRRWLNERLLGDGQPEDRAEVEPSRERPEGMTPA
jgi:hypothetical protein